MVIFYLDLITLNFNHNHEVFCKSSSLIPVYTFYCLNFLYRKSYKYFDKSVHYNML